MKKIDWRFALTLLMVLSAFVASIFINQLDDAELQTRSEQRSENIFGLSLKM